MAETPKDGGPAFPQLLNEMDACLGMEGMSLLDWFAGQAIRGFCSSEQLVVMAQKLADMKGMEANTVLAMRAYEVGQSMLAERQRRQEGEQNA